MFRPVPMKRLSAVVLERDERTVLRELGQMGVVQLARTTAGVETAPLNPPDRSRELARCERLQTRLTELRRALALPERSGATLPRETSPPESRNPLRGGSRSTATLHFLPWRAARGEPTRLHTSSGRQEMLGSGGTSPSRSGRFRVPFHVPSRNEAPHEPASFEEAEQTLRQLEDRVGDLTRHRDEWLRQQQNLAAFGERVGGDLALAEPLRQLGQSEFLHFVTGTLPPGQLSQLKLGPDVALFPLPSHRQRQRLMVISTRRGADALHEILRQAGFQSESLPALPLSAADGHPNDRAREQSALAEALAQAESDRQALAVEAAPRLAAIQRWLGVERRLFEAEQLFPRTQAAALITGWIPATEEVAVRERLHTCTHDRCAISVSEPAAESEEAIPVLLRHSRLLRPFALLVAAYGLPRYYELAPTLFVAVSFVLMFGMMFGDVGHGGLLALAGLATFLAARSSKIRDVGVLLLCNGSASATFGLIYGSYFGIPHLKAYALWHDPLEGDPMRLMAVSVGIGIVLMSLGLVLNIRNHLHRRNLIEGVLDKFGVMGVIFYWTALVLVAKSAAIQSHAGLKLLLLGLLVVPIVCWTLKGPIAYFQARRTGHEIETEGLFVAMTESVVGAFEGVLLYLANTVSFVRLAAYAMSHAALLMATFTLAAQVQSAPVGGSVLSLIVIVLGNAVALALEGIVATVQALRLEYYEFFGKFFAGGGQAFRPFELAVKPG